LALKHLGKSCESLKTESPYLIEATFSVDVASSLLPDEHNCCFSPDLCELRIPPCPRKETLKVGLGEDLNTERNTRSYKIISEEIMPQF
jgi:hypothetical protein